MHDAVVVGLNKKFLVEVSVRVSLPSAKFAVLIFGAQGQWTDVYFPSRNQKKKTFCTILL